MAAEWMGWENVFHVELNEFGRRILSYYWPDAISYEDITETDFTIHRGQIDIVSAGFPCQPASVAGKREGTEDDRWLWPETIRAIRECQPSYIVLENVFGLTSILESACETEMETKAVQLFSKGDDSEQVEQRISEVKKRAIGTIIEDINQAGYTLPETSSGEPIILCVPACAVNAPHRRDRVWFVAYSNLHGQQSRGFGEDRSEKKKSEGQGNQRKRIRNDNRGISEQGVTSNTSNKRCNNGGNNGQERYIQENQGTSKKDQSKRKGRKCGIGEVGAITSDTGLQRPQERQKQTVGINEFCKEWDVTDTVHKGSQRDKLDGSLDQEAKIRREQPSGSATQFHQISNWDKFPTQSPVCGRNDGISRTLDGITFPKWRNESIKAYGNAIVPQIAYQIFNALGVTK